MRIILLFLTMFILFTSCKKSCKNYDCPENNVYSFRFRIQDFTSHEDIFYSNNPLYDKNNFKIFAVKNNDTVYYSINQSPTDSTFGIAFMERNDTLFFKLNENDIDTLSLHFSSKESVYLPYEPVCCPNNLIITSKRYNTKDFNPKPKYEVYNKL